MRQKMEPKAKIYDPGADRRGEISQDHDNTVVIAWDNGRYETVAKRRLTPYFHHYILDVRAYHPGMTDAAPKHR